MRRRNPIKIREVDDATARSEILAVLDTALQAQYADEIADKLRIDTMQAIRICDELMDEGLVGVHDELVLMDLAQEIYPEIAAKAKNYGIDVREVAISDFCKARSLRPMGVSGT